MLPMIEAANVHPDYLKRPSITAEDLRRVQEPCVIFEHEWRDDDGERCFAYTVGGWLDGKMLGGMQGGVTVGGEVIVVHADSRQEADAIASVGLIDSVSALDGEEAAYVEAHAALARLQAAGPAVRIDKATAAPCDKSDEFERDAALIRPLRGDDIVLTVGGVEGAP